MSATIVVAAQLDPLEAGRAGRRDDMRTPCGNGWPRQTKRFGCRTRADLCSRKAWSWSVWLVKYRADRAVHDRGGRDRRGGRGSWPEQILEAPVRNVIGQFQQIVVGVADAFRRACGRLPRISTVSRALRRWICCASSLPFLTTDDKQQLLESASIQERLDKLNSHLAKELEVQQLRTKIQTEVQDQVQQSQRDYYLREQMKAIQKEPSASRTKASARPRSCARRLTKRGCRSRT